MNQHQPILHSTSLFLKRLGIPSKVEAGSLETVGPKPEDEHRRQEGKSSGHAETGLP